jgi:hypothetical protein
MALGTGRREVKAMILRKAAALLFGLKPRDPAVFDPKTFVDHAKYQDPAVLATDVLYLLVNGQFGVDKGS